MPVPLARCALASSSLDISTVILRAVSIVLLSIPYSIPAINMALFLGSTPSKTATISIGARILPPGLETGSANPLAAEPNLPANRVFLFSQTSDAWRPGSSVYHNCEENPVLQRDRKSTRLNSSHLG